MKALFDALRARYRAHPVLFRKGRDLLEGLNEEERRNVVKPYTEVNFTMSERRDSFDSDVETWEAAFRYHAGSIKTNAAHDWLEAMQDTFKDANITSPFFHCAGTRMVTSSGASEADGGYDASATFEIILQRRIRNPVTVGA